MSYNKIRKSRKVLRSISVVIQKKTWVRPMRIVPRFDFVTLDDLDIVNELDRRIQK